MDGYDLIKVNFQKKPIFGCFNVNFCVMTVKKSLFPAETEFSSFMWS